MYNKIGIFFIAFLGFIIPLYFSVNFSPVIGGGEGLAIIILLLSFLCSIITVGISIIYYKLCQIYDAINKTDMKD